MIRRASMPRVLPGLLLALTFAAPAAARQDELSLGSVTDAAAGDTVTVPIRVRDRSGTVLDTGAGEGREIRSVSLTVEYSPGSAVAAIDFERSGLTAGLNPRFETQAAATRRRSWIVSFDEAVPFTRGAQLVGDLKVRLASGTAVGTTVQLKIVAETTALANGSGTLLETEENGQLTTTDGEIEVGEAGCTQGPTLCLLDNRFRVEIDWVNARGESGTGRAVQLTSDSGYFWFFGPRNVEVVVKALDGQRFNGKFWIFYGALTDVRFDLEVTDSVTGVTKTYRNPLGTFASVGDTGAFPGDGATLPVGGAARLAGPVAPTPKAGSCVPSAEVLCLLDGRFQLTMDWRNFQGEPGTGKAVQLTRDSGYFWFFGSDNVELVVKTLDGTGSNGHYWVFYGALSSVEFTLTVTDTETGAVKSYENPPGTFASVGDTQAF